METNVLGPPWGMRSSFIMGIGMEKISSPRILVCAGDVTIETDFSRLASDAPTVDDALMLMLITRNSANDNDNEREFIQRVVINKSRTR